MANINDTDYLISSAVGAVHNKKVREAQRKRNYELSAMVEDMAINNKQKEPKTMKATLIFSYSFSSETDPKLDKLSHMVFETESPATARADALKSIEEILMVGSSARAEYIHVDGILFQVTEKPAVPVLADVITGIEL